VTGWAHALLRVHLLCAFGATALFWVAALSPKGGGPHRAGGRWFSRAIYGAALFGGLLALATLVAPASVHVPEPASPVSGEAARQTQQLMWLALYVLVILVAPVHHGVAVVAAGPQPFRLRTRLHATLCLLAMVGSVVLLPALIAWSQAMWLVVAPIGFVVGLRQLAYAAKPAATPAEWKREHLTSLLTAGVVLHTVLFVFGTSRTAHMQLEGWLAWLPWLLPAAVGVPLMLRLRRSWSG
jgi:hypothetical protein